MTATQFDFSDLTAYAAQLRRAAPGDAYHSLIDEGADEMERSAIAGAPRHDGDLQRGIRRHSSHATATGYEAIVEASARHSGFVEHGTYKDAAQPYWRPALRDARQKITSGFAPIVTSDLVAK